MAEKSSFCTFDQGLLKPTGTGNSQSMRFQVAGRLNLTKSNAVPVIGLQNVQKFQPQSYFALSFPSTGKG